MTAIKPQTLLPSRHSDTFARDNLPPIAQWPELIFTLPELQFPETFNCAERLLGEAVAKAGGAAPAIFHKDSVWSYADLAAAVDRMAHVLVEDAHLVSGMRVLLHGPNIPETLAAWLAIVKAGGIVVTTMPLLRSRELRQVVEKGKIELAICFEPLADALEPVLQDSPLRRIIEFGNAAAELEQRMAGKPAVFDAVPTSQDDVCLIAFTSGTTGEPKATMHFHRDVLAMCETFARHMIDAPSEAIFACTAPLGFTFGLGAILVFPLYFHAGIALPDGNTPAALAEAIQRHRATHIFTAPRAYKAIAAKHQDYDLSSIEICVSAGETLSKEISDLWHRTMGLRIVDGIGSTEMIHIFISDCGEDIRAGATGRPVPGYVADLFDAAGKPIRGPGIGRLGVRGPTGCRYLADPRQKDYVVNGWNMTGDVYRRDALGYYWWVARVDDMILSSGYNISGPEVEAAILLHPDVEECAVVGWPDAERGAIVKAFVVPRHGVTPGPALVQAIQEHAKKTLAPYKYPRAVEFRSQLPKTVTGKLRRSALRMPMPAYMPHAAPRTTVRNIRKTVPPVPEAH
jgi:2-aminobenzoate-CoA ligase